MSEIDDKPEDIEPAAATEDTPAADAAPDEGRTAAPVDEDLEGLLEQYDRSVQSRQPAVEQPLQPPDQLYPWERDAQAADIAQREQTLAQVLQRQQQAAYVAAELREFDKLVDEAQQSIADVPHLPPDFARRYLISEAMMKPELRQLWDSRNNPQLPPQTRRMIAGRLRSVMHELYETAHAQVDPIASADREAVIAAVRGASVPRGPEPAPRYGHMSDREFQRQVREQHGFDPLI